MWVEMKETKDGKAPQGRQQLGIDPTMSLDGALTSSWEESRSYRRANHGPAGREPGDKCLIHWSSPAVIESGFGATNGRAQ